MKPMIIVRANEFWFKVVHPTTAFHLELPADTCWQINHTNNIQNVLARAFLNM